MLENIIVYIIVGAVLVFAGRSLYRTLTGKKGGCSGCGTKSCPAADRCPASEAKPTTRGPRAKTGW